MPHAPSDAPPPRRKRKPAPPPHRAPANETYLPHGGPVHDTPPNAPAPTYGPGRISKPSTTLDQVLALGAGPLRLPEGKIALPQRSHTTRPPQLAAPIFTPPAAGQRQPPAPYESLFGQHGRTVVPPATQAYLEQQLGGKHGEDEANYILQSPDVETLNQRAQELGLAPGTGLGNLVQSINDAIGEPTHQIAGFPETGRTALPSYVRSLLLDRIHHVEKTTGLTANLGDHPTDADIVRASFHGPHHASYWDVLRNLPRDLVETPLYAYQGGVALGYAANRAAHGDINPLREVAAQQVDAIRHPGAFVQQHPFQALLAGSAGLKGLGGATARARGVVEEPRIIPTRHEGVTIDRGVSPANDYVRGVQGIQDLLTQPHAPGSIADRLGLNRVASKLQDQGLKKNTRQRRAHETAVVAQENAPFARELDRAAGGISRRESERVLGNEAMGVTPEELAAFHGVEPTAAGPLSSGQQRYLEAAGAYRGRSENVMEDLGLLGGGARIHRNVDPLAQVLADQGHPLATRYLEVNQELSDLQQQLERTPHGDPKARALETRIQTLRTQIDRDRQVRVDELDKRIVRLRKITANKRRPVNTRHRASAELKSLTARRDALVRGEQPHGDITNATIRRLEQRQQETPTRGMLEGKISQAFTDRNQLLERISQERAAQGMPEPFRVPLERAQERQGFFGSRSTGSPAGVKRRGKRQYTGRLFESGDYKPPTHEAFVRDLEAPLHAQGYHRLINRITDPNEGLAHRIVNDGAEDIPIPDDLVVVKPAQVLPDRTPETFKPGESFASRLDYQTDHVPPGGEALVVPRSVAEELVKGGRQIDSGATLDRRISQALRNVLLYSRPAYVATNLQGNILQNSLENVGPISYARAVRGVDNRLPLPPGIEEGGAARTNFTSYEQTFRDALDADTRAKVVAGLLGAFPKAYTRTLFRAARAVEDATRRAAYYKKAVPAARRVAYADEPRVQRFLASFRGVTPAMQQILEMMAKGEGPEVVQTAAASAVQATNRVLGDFAALPSNRVVDFVAPFHRWAQFATRLLVVSLPLHYPGKALLLYRLGSLGQNAQSQLGPLTPANQGIVPIGGPADATQVLGTAYPNSFATLADALASDQRGESNIFGLNWRRGASYLNPFISTAYGDLTGFDPQTGYAYHNPRGENILASPDSQHPADPNAGTDVLRLALGQALSLIAPLRLLQPPQAADTSIPLPGLTQGQHKPQVPAYAKGLEPPQTTLPLSREQQWFNLFSPFKIKTLNLSELARQGVNTITAREMATQRKEAG